MKRVLLLAAAFAVAVSVVATAFGAGGKLVGTDGPGFTISLTQGGKKVKALKAGSYTLTVNDKASIHNFVVEGPGVARDITTVPFKGTKTVTLKLRAGKYKFYCRPHESSMFGFVTVK
jgi:hypothetical protein